MGFFVLDAKNRHSGYDDFVEKISTINVKRTAHAILERSPILKEMLENGSIGTSVAAMKFPQAK
jgi:carbonic anhydrase